MRIHNHLLIILALCLLLGLTGCGRGSAASAMLPPPGTTQSAPDADSPTNNNGTPAVELPDDYLSGDSQPIHGELTERQSGDVIEIGEKLFVALTNDIYLNADDYLGKTIKYEGIYQSFTWEAEGEADAETYHSVIRYGPGCCGTDGNAGFEVSWDGGWPQEDDWVEVVGTLEIVEYNGWPFLQLRLDSLTVMDERGAEYVVQ